jgi:pimeloyl-ACP methyl ester carboxylesterase
MTVSDTIKLTSTFVNSDGLSIHWQQAGCDVPDTLCIHGFSSSFRRNWYGAGWVRALLNAGHSPCGPDLRGHGQSDKPHIHGAYHPLVHISDIDAGLTQLSSDRVHVIGFSMGAAVALQYAMLNPERCKSLTLIGVGDKIIDTYPPPMEPMWIADALSTSRPDLISSAVGRTFRAFAERGQNDLEALAAMMRTGGWPGRIVERHPVIVPTQLILAERDAFMPTNSHLIEAISPTKTVVIQGTDHLSLALSPQAIASTLEFIGETDA